jgi:hypothetical protein
MREGGCETIALQSLVRSATSHREGICFKGREDSYILLDSCLATLFRPMDVEVYVSNS